MIAMREPHCTEQSLMQFKAELLHRTTKGLVSFPVVTAHAGVLGAVDLSR
jgi:hypothetical protein